MGTAMVIADAPLTPGERKRWEYLKDAMQNCEARLEEYAFEACSRRLYREEYGSWAEFCDEAFSKGRHRGYQLVNHGALKKIASLPECRQIVNTIPNEHVARQILKDSPVLREAVRTLRDEGDDEFDRKMRERAVNELRQRAEAKKNERDQAEKRRREQEEARSAVEVEQEWRDKTMGLVDRLERQFATRDVAKKVGPVLQSIREMAIKSKPA